MQSVTNFFTDLAASTAWNAAVKFNRNNALPLDGNSVFASLADLQTYASTSPVAYPGQVCVVIEEGSAVPYVLKTELVGGVQTGVPVPINELADYIQMDGEGGLNFVCNDIDLSSDVDGDIVIGGENLTLGDERFTDVTIRSTGGVVLHSASDPALIVGSWQGSSYHDGKIRGVGTPTENNDAANKLYVDGTVQRAVDTIPKFGIVVVDALPASGAEGTIYLVKTGTTPSTNLYTEYIWLNSSYIEAEAATRVYFEPPQSGTAASLVLYNFLHGASGALTFTILNGETLVREFNGDAILIRSDSSTAGYYNFTSTNAVFLDYLSNPAYSLVITIPSGQIVSNVYQYVRITYSNGRWEQLGTQELDLTNYLTKTEAASTYLTQTAAATDYMAKFGEVLSEPTTNTVHNTKTMRFSNKTGNTTNSTIAIHSNGVTFTPPNQTHQVNITSDYATYYQSPDFGSAPGNVIPDKQYVDDQVAQVSATIIWQGVTGGSVVLEPTEHQTGMYIDESAAYHSMSGAMYYVYSISPGETWSVTTWTSSGRPAVLTSRAATTASMTSDNTYVLQTGTDANRHTYTLTDSTSGIQILIVNSFDDVPVVRRLSAT